MAFFPRLSYLSLYGGELHRKGGVLMKARLSEWERELQYLRFRIAEWKEFGTADHPDYYGFRSFLLHKVRNHLHFELKTLSSILMACEVAARSDDVPPLQNYIDAIYAFRERISPGEITRRIHLEEWHRYIRTRDEETSDTQPQMDDMFAKIRTEIAGMERRIKEFKLMVDELVRMVGAMKGIDRLRQEGARRVRLRGQDGSVVSGYLVRGATRIPPHPVHGPGSARRMVRSPTDLLPMPILANSRARLPPLISPPPPPPSPIPNANNSSSPRRVPTSTSSSGSRSRLRQAARSSAAISRTIIHSSSPSPPPTPPRPARNNIHRGFFRRVFHMSQNTDADTTPLPPRTPSPSPVRSPSPLDSSPPSDPEFSRHASPSVSSIAETRARLPPSPEESPVPYRPPLFSALNRL